MFYITELFVVYAAVYKSGPRLELFSVKMAEGPYDIFIRASLVVSGTLAFRFDFLF